jgi:RNA polymerase sigma factor (sigma-70 family)
MSGTQTLLSEYTQDGSERAFRELVGSYVSFVFSTALRIVGGDRPLAEDVTQTVFTDLARKAVSLPKDVRLGGWLHRHTCFIARKTLRRERRRIAREKQAIELHNPEDYSEANLAQIGLVLDEVINDLSEQDRNAIVLRFFEELDFRSIGEALGSTEDAARMRVSRAVEKLGGLLKRRGIVLTAAGISFVLSGKLASVAPAGLVTRIVYVELARPVKVGLFAILKEACFTGLNVGIVSAAVILGVLVLLMSGRHAPAKVAPDPNGQTFTPAEFADLAAEPDDEKGVQMEAASRAAPPSVVVAAPSVAPKSTVVVPVQTVSAKPVAVNVARAQSVQQGARQLPETASTDSSDSGPAFGDGRILPVGMPGGSPRQQRLLPNSAPRVMAQPAVSAVPTNNASAPLVRTPPPLNTLPGALPQPGTPTRIAATTEPEIMLPNPGVNGTSLQAPRPVQPQRLLPSSRSNDPRKRGQQP